MSELPSSADDLHDALKIASRVLTEAGVPSPSVDAQLLAGHLMGCSKGEVLARALAGARTPEGYFDLVEQRAQRTPLQHLTGTAAFRQLELSVGPGVFIPRPETECLVQTVVDWLGSAHEAPTLRHPVVIDLATGSGAIAAAIASENPSTLVYAVELSALAHAWAQRNLAGLANVELVHGDARTAFDELEAQADVVVSNPPYVPEGAVPRDPEVRDHDPELALYGGGGDGLQLPVAFALRARFLLKPGGLLAMEHGEEQGAALRAILRTLGFSDPVTTKDFTHRDRVTSAMWNG